MQEAQNTLRMRALIVVLAVVSASGFIGFCRRGKQEQDAFIITGDRRRLAAPQTSSIVPSLAGSSRAAPEASAPAADVVVHVAGLVKKPGVVHLKPGARVIDALQAAGGALANADLDSLNLAARVEDGVQIRVQLRRAESAPPDAAAAPPPGPDAHSAREAGSSKLTQPGSGVVNINTAGSEELQRLPGIGPAMAERILQHRRENGSFTEPQQLMDVSGIGEKKFERMRPFVRVR